MTIREEVLDEAKQYVSKDRNSTYDSPENNFGRIAAIMNAQGYRKVVMTPGGAGDCDVYDLQGHDVALMMMAVKLARLAHSPDHKDSWVDTAGYAACGYDALLAELTRTRGRNECSVRRGAGWSDGRTNTYSARVPPRVHTPSPSQ